VGQEKKVKQKKRKKKAKGYIYRREKNASKKGTKGKNANDDEGGEYDYRRG